MIDCSFSRSASALVAESAHLPRLLMSRRRMRFRSLRRLAQAGILLADGRMKREESAYLVTHSEPPVVNRGSPQVSNE